MILYTSLRRLAPQGFTFLKGVLILRTFKKIIFITLALLPLLVVLGVVVNSWSSGGTPLQIGNIEMRYSSGHYRLLADQGTWSSYLIDPIFNRQNSTGFFDSFFGLIANLNTSIGLPINFYTIGSSMLMLYYLWIFILDFLVDFLTFVPRKCLEIFL